MALAVVLSAAAPVALRAQEDAAADSRQIERMVREGKVEALQSRFRGGRTCEELRLLALAQSNKAARIQDDRRRQRAFQDAEMRYLTWISAEERNREAEPAQRTVGAATARVAQAGMILSQWAAADLDAFELTSGKQCETRRLFDLLLKARGLYEQAAEAIRPLADELLTNDPELEDRYLALGIYDTIPRLRLEIRFNRAWANLYVGIVDADSSARRADALRAAERDFQGLVDSDQGGETAARCLLGLAMTLREQGRCDEARRYFDSALETTEEAMLAAQVRYERARSEIRGGRFEEARITLRPLVDKDPDRLDPEDRPARFYVNLAHLWDANSYLEEALRLEQTAETSPAQEAIRLRARRLREIGLRKMNHLASRGGRWPALVQLFVADAIDPNADEKTLTAAELLFSARQHSEKKRYRRALVRLNEAAAREQVAPDLAAEILFELGVCHYQCGETREAAEAFERMAREHKDHEKAAQAIGYAYQLWASVAAESKRPEEYLRFADVAASLLHDFPEHEKRAEALWWLPAALQTGGRYREAAARFADVPNDSPQWEEAQYRQALCGRLALDAERVSLSKAQLLARTTQVAEELTAYARQAAQRVQGARHPDAVREWSAAALVGAAELHASAGVEQDEQALDLLADFEQRFEGSEQIGRVLAVRIRAYRGLRQYEKAIEVVNEFLRTVPPEQAGGTLAVVARGMQEEVERLEGEGNTDAARKLAAQSIPTFEQLLAWIEADPSREEYLEAVRYGLARMCYVAGQYDRAHDLLAGLLETDARNGNYQRLNALVLTAALTEDASAEQLAVARDAWSALLRDPALRAAAPQRYWEARYHYLSLLLRDGRAAEVESAIRQERVWYPNLDGAGWEERLDELYQRAAAQIGKDVATSSQPAATQPVTTQPASAVPVAP